MAVGQRFINKVMEEVLTKFQPGILPHYFVMQTFANLSVSNGELGSVMHLGCGGSGCGGSHYLKNSAVGWPVCFRTTFSGSRSSGLMLLLRRLLCRMS